jgi:hypothetical protein
LEESISQLKNIIIVQNEAIAGLNQKIIFLNNTCSCQLNGSTTPQEPTPSLDPCMNARLNIITDSGYTCFNGTGTATPGRVLVNVERGAEDFVPIGMKLVVTGGGQAKIFTIRDKITGTGPISGQPANYSDRILDIPGINEARTYVIDTGMSTTISVSVAPIVKEGDAEKICEATSMATLTPCRTG